MHILYYRIPYLRLISAWANEKSGLLDSTVSTAVTILLLLLVDVLLLPRPSPAQHRRPDTWGGRRPRTIKLSLFPPTTLLLSRCPPLVTQSPVSALLVVSKTSNPSLS